MLTAAVFSLPFTPRLSLAASGPDRPAVAAKDAEQAGSPYRLSAQSSSYKISGAVNQGVLTLRLSRAADGGGVAGAKVGLTIDGLNAIATEKRQGVYVYEWGTLSSPKPVYEVVITVEDGKNHDLLVGRLGITTASGGAEQQHGHREHDNRGHDDHADQAASAHKHNSSEEGHDHDRPNNPGEKKDGHKHDDHGSNKEEPGHDDHGEEGHSDEREVKLTPALMREFGVKTTRAEAGSIAKMITRPAEVSYNLDYFTHVVPRVAGIAKSINVSQGDLVKAGQVLAILESRELAELKAAYLAAIERFDLAAQEFQRMQALRKKQIASEKSYLTARSVFVEARIAARSARQKLSSIGINRQALKRLVKEPDASFTSYSMHSPMGGVVVSRHLVKGELVSDQREAFVIADLSSVWIDISVYASDIPLVRAGQKVRLETETGEQAEGSIAFVSPDVSETTRTAKARVVVKGKSASFRPGMFINAHVAIGETDVALRIPTSALHVQDSDTVIFTGENGIFKPRVVKVGRKNGQYAEIIDGLRAGEVYATDGSFLIKAQLSKAAFGDGHNH